MSEQRTIRWGIAGTGSMAAGFIGDFAHVDGAEVVAVGSRDAGRARAFADEHGIARAHGSYAELCADPEVDVVYVATPHPQHKAVALQAIENHTAVLVEKAFTATVAGAREVVEAARREGVFCMEAMWTRFHPAVVELHRIIDDGEIGTVRTLQGDLLAQRDFDESSRLFAKDLGGGALLDLGVYPISFAHDLLGMPDELVVRGTLYPNGVDAQAVVLARWGNEQVASLACGFQAGGPKRFVVAGETGWVEVIGPFHNPSRLVVHRAGTEPQELDVPPAGRGYSHEIRHVSDAVREGRTESDVMPLQGTLEVMELLEQATAQLGITYAEDDERR